MEFIFACETPAKGPQRQQKTVMPDGKKTSEVSSMNVPDYGVGTVLRP